jgi:hypothetical protein
MNMKMLAVQDSILTADKIYLKTVADLTFSITIIQRAAHQTGKHLICVSF